MSKPCLTKRKEIAWLALGELDAARAGRLRAHLEHCEGCRRYYEEIADVSGKLEMLELSPEIQATGAFHNRLMGQLRASEPVPWWKRLRLFPDGFAFNWQPVVVMAFPVLFFVVLAVVGAIQLRSPEVPTRPPQAPLASPLDEKLPPTLSNYYMVANQSLDKLDELLTKQGNRTAWAAPVYTASAVDRAVSPE
jgi:Putative zinc-finger